MVQPIQGGFLISQPIATADMLLRSMSLDIHGVNSFAMTIKVEVHDLGLTGACSGTNPNPCDKVAKATLYIEGYPFPGMTDRIFLDSFQPH